MWAAATSGNNLKQKNFDWAFPKELKGTYRKDYYKK